MSCFSTCYPWYKNKRKRYLYFFQYQSDVWYWFQGKARHEISRNNFSNYFKTKLMADASGLGTCPLLSVQFCSLVQFSVTILPNNRLAPLSFFGAPQGNPGFATDNVYMENTHYVGIWEKAPGGATAAEEMARTTSSRTATPGAGSSDRPRGGSPALHADQRHRKTRLGDRGVWNYSSVGWSPSRSNKLLLYFPASLKPYWCARNWYLQCIFYSLSF